MKLIRRLHYLLNRRKLDAELAEEMAFHQALSGSVAMGNTTLAREDARGVWIFPWLESVAQDLSYAVRSFLRQPGFTAIAVVALASAIGLNTSLFTVFNAVALRPWNVKDSGRVVKIYAWTRNPPRGFDNAHGFSMSEFRYLQEHTRTMSGMFATRGEGGVHMGDVKTRLEYVSANYFRVLGVDLARGRGFLSEEDNAGAPTAVAVLSHSAWQSRFGGDAQIVGRQVRLEETPFTIVGVAPENFRGTSPELTDFWIPVSAMPLLYPNEAWARDFVQGVNSCCGDLAGRLASGVTREQARAELSVLHIGYHRQLNEKSDGVELTGTALLEKTGMKTRKILVVFDLMFGGVLLVLLLACANVGNLLLARAAARRREIGIRLSVGAARARLVRQLLTESFALALFAGALGVTVAYVLPGPLFRSAVGDVSFSLKPDAPVLGFTLGLAMLACITFGLAPALHATRGNFSDALRKNHTRLPLRSFLLAVQVAVSVILLVGTGLLTRGIQRVRALDPGFAVKGIASIALEFPASAYAKPRMTSFYSELAGATAFGLSTTEPLGNSRNFNGFKLAASEKEEQRVLVNNVSPEYFDVLRIPIVAGHNFRPSDIGRPVVLVNEAFVNRHFAGANPVGKIIFSSGPQEIVGVARNAHTWGLDEVEPAMYTPVSYGQAPRLLLRNTPANIAEVTAAVNHLDPRVRIQVRTLDENLDRWLSTSRMGAVIAGMLGMLALALASIGIAGVFHYGVQQRTQEIGIRMALGARPRQVIALVLGSTAKPLAGGLAVGLAGALAASRLIQQYLYGLSRLDVVTYGAVLATLAAAGLAATFLPTRKAIHVDPVRALHYE